MRKTQHSHTRPQGLSYTFIYIYFLLFLYAISLVWHKYYSIIPQWLFYTISYNGTNTRFYVKIDLSNFVLKIYCLVPPLFKWSFSPSGVEKSRKRIKVFARSQILSCSRNQSDWIKVITQFFGHWSRCSL